MVVGHRLIAVLVNNSCLADISFTLVGTIGRTTAVDKLSAPVPSTGSRLVARLEVVGVCFLGPTARQWLTEPTDRTAGGVLQTLDPSVVHISVFWHQLLGAQLPVSG